MNQQKGQFHITKNQLAFLLLFPVIFFYFELVFRISTIGTQSNHSIPIILLFSIIYGCVFYLITTLSKKPYLNHVLAITLMSLLSAGYVVEYFVYRQFKVFYDINTITGGAGGAMTDYAHDVKALVLSPDGILKIVLFLLPFLIYFFWAKKWMDKGPADAMRRGLAVGILAICCVLSFCTIASNDAYRPAYTSEYNYQTAVERFGLATAARLDVKNMITGDAGGSFEMVDNGGNPSAPDGNPSGDDGNPSGDDGNPSGDGLLPQSPSATAPPQAEEPQFNVMDLNFSKEGSKKIQELNAYVSSLTPSKQNEMTGIFKGKNLIMISAEAFTAEVIDPILTPTLHRMATKGINFTDYYQPASAGTTGGEYQNVFGMMPTAGGMSFKNTADNLNYFTMGSQLDRLGYYGKAYHNNDYMYYDRHKTHINLGYSDGFMGYGNGMEEYVSRNWPQSDLEMIAGTLPTYIDKQPFNIYYMSVSGHSGYSKAGNAMTRKNWSLVENLNRTDQIKGYYAANIELENAMAHLISELEAKGIEDDTVICISADHFPYGLDKDGKFGNMPYLSELYGYDVTNYFERDHNRLILWCGCLEDSDPIIVDAPTSSLDIVPTLSNLFGTEFDSRLMPGRDVFSDAEAIVFNMNYDWKTEYGTYYSSKGQFVPAEEGAQISPRYVDRVKAIVRNKRHYCELALDNDYFRYLFGE